MIVRDWFASHATDGSALPAYVICYFERSGRLDQDTRAALAQRLYDRWATVGLQVDGFWILQAKATSDQIRDELLSIVPDGNGLIVLSLGRDAAWTGVEPDEIGWLIEHL